EGGDEHEGLAEKEDGAPREGHLEEGVVLAHDVAQREGDDRAARRVEIGPLRLALLVLARHSGEHLHVAATTRKQQQKTTTTQRKYARHIATNNTWRARGGSRESPLRQRRLRGIEEAQRR